jgi:hypothetical protein
MQTAGELAGLEGTISLWGTEHTGVTSSGSRERARRPRRPFQGVITSGVGSKPRTSAPVATGGQARRIATETTVVTTVVTPTRQTADA